MNNAILMAQPQSLPAGKLSANVNRGKHLGVRLTPHQYAEGYFIVSKSKFADDQVQVRVRSDLPEWVNKGFGVRMSNPAVHRGAPSLIAPESIGVTNE
jgi:hypothetical protein